MAKRKSTDKTSNNEPDKKDDTVPKTDQIELSEASTTDLETAAEAVDAVEVYAPADKTPDSDLDTATDTVKDEIVEQSEPNDDVSLTSENADVVDGDAPTSELDAVSDVSLIDDEHISEEEAERLIEEAESGENHSADPVPAHEASVPPVAPQVIKETTIERKGGLVPMVLGGAAAAVLGYGVAAYSSQAVWPFETAQDTGFEDEIRGALTTQDGALSELGARIDALEGVELPTVDLTPVENEIEAVQSSVADMSTRLDEIIARIESLERQPLENAVSEEAIAAYERALADLQAEVEAQRAEVAQMAQEAVAAEDNAEEKAQLAASRAAMAEITTALENGAPFSDAVAVLASNGVEVPDILAERAESGVLTQANLTEAFPEVAREALNAARSADTDGAEGVGRLTTFFANQLGARSVAPKEGDDPDAVLSRAEAAVRSGNLNAALDELAMLPDVAQAALSDWQAGAQTRLEAKTAADTLVQQLLQ